jgi:superfamily II DNA helicase RecQ
MGYVIRVEFDHEYIYRSFAGHDFRRDYSQLGVLIETFFSFENFFLSFFFIVIEGQLRLNYPEINITLLTATATPRIQQDILQQLNITENYKLFLQSFNRANLIYECIPKENIDLALSQIANLIKINYKNQSGIIYCFSRAECDRTGSTQKNKLNLQFQFIEHVLAQYLLAHNIHALSYHAGLNDSLRQTIHMRWIHDECQVRYERNIDLMKILFHLGYLCNGCIWNGN